MKIHEIIKNLQDQAKDRLNLIPEGEPDSIFAHDAEALLSAVELLETMQRFQRDHKEVSGLVTELRRKGLANGGSLGHHAGIMDEAADAIMALEYTIIGIMHAVDKWLDGPELEQDEVNRAATMREKTLQIVEKLQRADTGRLQEFLEAEQAGRAVILPEVPEADRQAFVDGLHDYFQEAANYDPSVGIFGMRDGEAKLANALMAALKGEGNEN